MTTLEQLKALSDEELTERLAVEVMGWHKGEAQWLDSGGNGMASLPNSYCVDCGQIFDWNPTNDWNHTMEVLSRIENRRGIRMSRFPFRGPKGASYVEVWSVWVEGCGEAVVHYSLQRAILIAALLAVQAPLFSEDTLIALPPKG